MGKRNCSADFSRKYASHVFSCFTSLLLNVVGTLPLLLSLCGERSAGSPASPPRFAQQGTGLSHHRARLPRAPLLHRPRSYSCSLPCLWRLYARQSNGLVSSRPHLFILSCTLSSGTHRRSTNSLSPLETISPAPGRRARGLARHLAAALHLLSPLFNCFCKSRQCSSWLQSQHAESPPYSRRMGEDPSGV